jgi:3-keto-disaccharide hydrolase
MKSLLALASVILVCASAPSSSNGAVPIPLVDGKTFKGWDGDTNKIWRIQDGAFVGGSLSANVPRNEFLATTRSFTNFVLRLKFKLVGTEGFVNGGVQIRSERTQKPPNEMSGYQVDLGEPEWWGCLYDESRRNKVVAKSDINAINKVLKRQDWNEYVIRAEGKRIRASINGVQTVDYTEPDDTIPQYGKIGLQVHGGGKTEAWYKDITIEQLP